MNRELDEALDRYRTALRFYTKSVKRATETSHATKGLTAGAQRYWASVVFTRLVSVASGVLFIAPESLVNESSQLWDFCSIASLIRAVFETVLTLQYLGLDELSDDEWKFRIALIHLNDCTERIRLFDSLGDHAFLAGLVPMAMELRRRVKSYPNFNNFTPQLQKDMLRGEKATAYGKEQILIRMNVDPSPVLSFYRFISNYIHNYPMGFHRTDWHGRDGTLNAVDVGYSAIALTFANEWLETACVNYEKKFADLATFGAASYDLRNLRKNNISKADELLINRAFHT